MYNTHEFTLTDALQYTGRFEDFCSLTRERTICMGHFIYLGLHES